MSNYVLLALRARMTWKQEERIKGIIFHYILYNNKY